MKGFASRIAMVAGVGFIAIGLWAFVAPSSFFDALATFKPYNRHFVHDIGSFQVGLGAVLVLAALVRDGLLVALSGVTIGSGFHVVSHLLDRNIGGKPTTDIPFFTVITLVLAAAAWVRAREGSQNPPPG